MKHMVHILLVAIAVGISVRGVRGSGAIVEGSDNAEQFALLCRIYNVAKNPPINHVDVQDPLKIVEEIDALNASFAEEKQINEAEQEVNSSVPHVKTTITREAAVAQAILNQITRKAHKILEEIGRVNATRDIEKVKAAFDHVIFGEGMNESNLCNGVLKDVGERGNACGPAGLQTKGKSAGRNLVVDFFCLCAQRPDSNGIDNACKVKVGSKSEKHSWGTEAPSGSMSMWTSIKKECENLLHKAPKSTEEGHEVLGDFLKHIKSGGLYRWGDTRSFKGSDRKVGMLGTSAGTEQEKGGDILCDGSKGAAQKNSGKPGGICVYYGPDKWEENIDWLKKLRIALTTVDALNNQTATIQRNIQKLLTLLHRAEKIYETAKVILEVQHPAVPPNLQTAAKRFTAYNAAWKHHHNAHFILLFVLFL